MILTGLMVSRIFAPEPSAASLRLSAVKAGFEALGVKMDVVTTSPPPGIDAESDASVKRLPVLRDSEGYVKGYLSYASFDVQALFQILTMPKADFVLVEPPPTTGTVARIACAVRHTPYFWYAADVWSDATDGMDVPNVVKKFVRGLETFAIRGARGCIAVSEGVAECVDAMGAKDIKVVPNGADTGIFNPRVPELTEEQKSAIGISKPYFIYAGTASTWQGADLFARAFERFWDANRNAQFLYLTRGDSVPDLEDIASRLKLKAEDLGLDYAPLIVSKTVPAEEAAQWQREAVASCVSIQPGIGYDLAYPTKVLTALSCGTPVIYAGVGPATRDILENDLGLAVPYGESEVGEAMEALIESVGHDNEWNSERLHKWVVDNRSMQSAGATVARYITEKIS